MAHTATGNKGDLIALSMRTHDDIVCRLRNKRRICLHVAIDHLTLDISRIVDELFHSKSSRKKNPAMARGQRGIRLGDNVTSMCMREHGKARLRSPMFAQARRQDVPALRARERASELAE